MLCRCIYILAIFFTEGSIPVDLSFCLRLHRFRKSPASYALEAESPRRQTTFENPGYVADNPKQDVQPVQFRDLNAAGLTNPIYEVVDPKALSSVEASYDVSKAKLDFLAPEPETTTQGAKENGEKKKAENLYSSVDELTSPKAANVKFPVDQEPNLVVENPYASLDERKGENSDSGDPAGDTAVMADMGNQSTEPGGERSSVAGSVGGSAEEAINSRL